MATDDEVKTFHDRADHEDQLHASRTDLFVSFNGIMAVAVGFADDKQVKLIFVAMVLLVNVAWALWAPNARIFVRALRDAGSTRCDESLWATRIGPTEMHKIRRWFTDPLTILTIYFPRTLVLGWFILLIYWL
jgi:hypothetical protein